MHVYPFGAVVGSDDLALALTLCAVSPTIGGVLVRGEKGTAKSTTVRAHAALLPPVTVVDECRFSCDPDAPDPSCPDGPHPADTVSHVRPVRLVELPVGAAEDRVTGALHLGKALADRTAEYEPGLLALAHRGVLYVDEVNLLHDHLVDLLLDAAAMGRSTVERDGVSVEHASRFVLVGTMNPEEGELRPQLLDRFGLAVDVTAPRDPHMRAEIVRRRMAFDADPAGFTARWADRDAEWSRRVASARELVPQVALSDDALVSIAEVCAAFDVDGMRADLVTARTAIAHAAWHDRLEVTREDSPCHTVDAATPSMPPPAATICSTNFSVETIRILAPTTIPVVERAHPTTRRRRRPPVRVIGRPPAWRRRRILFAPGCSPSIGSGAGRPVAGRGRSPRSAVPWVVAAATPARIICPPRSARPPSPIGVCRCAARSSKAARPISSCSASTHPGRWQHATGWCRSRPLSCRCCSTPTAVATPSDS